LHDKQQMYYSTHDSGLHKHNTPHLPISQNQKHCCLHSCLNSSTHRRQVKWVSFHS